MLSERDVAIVCFERDTPANDLKQTRIRETFGLSEARYFQTLNRILDDPDALRAEPMLVKRLLRQRSERVQKRLARAV